MTLVAIDPDTKKCGFAVFAEDGHLVGAVARTLADAAPWIIAQGTKIRALCEMPQQYGRQGDQRDFLALARVVGNVEHWFKDRGFLFETVAPLTWKGTTPKTICTLRAWEALCPSEQAKVRLPVVARNRLEAGRGLASGEGSDVLDAIGIGLWKLGRLHKKLF